ncbi:hypothetical protein B0H16DRAFT_1555155 [Mycena metata]|uniref:Uncharacterized protein n=1 Tax=Mycena metata TaxID=1033252 RepID=A0AAD7INI1_9AGAR|nr:hypothetical protein B0H16DRAFT_1555155 [Mycena metata]
MTSVCLSFTLCLLSQLINSSQTGSEIRPINLFSRETGVGLGLTGPLPLVEVPRSTDEFNLIPITDVAPDTPDSSSPAQSPASAEESSSSPSPTPASLSPSPVVEPPTASASNSSTVPAGTLARHTHPPPAPAATKVNAQHAGLGLGLPSALRQALQKQASPTPAASSSSSPAASPTAAKKWRLHSTVHELFSTRKFQKRALFSIPEIRPRETSAEATKSAGVVEEPRSARSTSTEQERRPSQRLRMSPAMLLAAQSILDEDKKFRRKEGLDKPSTLKKRGGVRAPTPTPTAKTMMSPVMRLASQVEQEQRNSKQKQAGAEGSSKKQYKFLF